jgi:transposase
MARPEELTDEQWSLIESLFGKPPTMRSRGRPRRPDREVLNGVLWILRSGARWCVLPERFPPYQTCHRRFQQWAKDGPLSRILETLAEDLRTRNFSGGLAWVNLGGEYVVHGSVDKWGYITREGKCVWKTSP